MKAPFDIYTLEGISKDKSTLQIEKHMQPCYEITLTVEGSTKSFGISFTEDFFMQADEGPGPHHHSGLLREFLQSPELTIEKEVAEDLQDLASLMLRERQKYSLLRAEILSKYLKIFMIYYRNELRKHASYDLKLTTSNSLVNDFFSELESNFKECRTVGHYAKALYVTPNYLNHVIKTRTGFSARYHIQQRILLAAKKAARTHSTMKEIAFHLGFNDMAHFSKFFKNVSGLNFSEFKKRMNEQYALA